MTAETFGHEPVTGLSLFDMAETVCARCTERGVWFSRGDDNPLPVRVPWPCATAVVLGIADQ